MDSNLNKLFYLYLVLLWSLIKTLVDGSCKINNTWLGFSLSLKRICITGTQSNHCPKGSLSTTSPTFYFNLPYIGHFSVITKEKIRYYNHLDIKLIFSSFNIGNVKDPVPGSLSSGEVYKFEYVGCNGNYVGETVRQFSTRMKKHLASERVSHTFKYLQNSEHCRALCSADCVHVLDPVSTSFQLKIKEAIHT